MAETEEGNKLSLSDVFHKLIHAAGFDEATANAAHAAINEAVAHESAPAEGGATESESGTGNVAGADDAPKTDEAS